jgi:hypothetical protein
MTLADKIAGLPERPRGSHFTYRADEQEWYWHTAALAALARLELAREWIEQTHLHGCSGGKWSMKTGRYEECDCGRDALLKALEAKP